jgi:multidrug transporter EmrE-like cation transporter
MNNHIYIFLTVLFTVYGQLVIKWQVNQSGSLPLDNLEKIQFIIGLLLNPWIFTGFASAFLASLSWMAAMTKFPLSYAYPFTSLAFVSVAFLSTVFFNEAITLSKSVGLGLVILGIIMGSKG